MVEVRFEHVSKCYAKSSDYVINDLNLDVRDHEFLMLVGPSGCGNLKNAWRDGG
jgi:multiple sugar transport system ATP-binding protein